MFFVISGFLIPPIARRIGKGTFSLVDFYERRFRRIYPNLVIVLATTTLLGWFALIMQTYQVFGRTLVWAALPASNFAFMGCGGYFDPGNLTKPLLHTWSLGVEEQFYLVFPWLLMLAARRGYRTARLVSGVVVLSLALSFIGYHLWEMPIRRRQVLNSRRSLFAALAVSVALFVAAGTTIYNTRGFPQRLPKEIADIYQTTKANSRLVVKGCPKDEGHGYQCPVGSQEAERVSFFIIGDSHSEAAAAEIGDVAAQYGLRGLFFGKSACKLFAEPVLKSTVDCIPQDELATKRFAELSPGLIIAITRWPDFLSDDSSDKDLPTRYHSTEEVLDRTLSFYAGSEFVTSLAIPTYQTNIAEFTGRNWFRSRMGLSVPPVPTMPLAEYRDRQASVRGLLDAMKRKHPNLSVVDPASALCPGDTCISMSGGKPLYYDTNHLSHQGAVLYASLFRPYFEELAKRLAGAAEQTPAQPSNGAN